MTDEELIEQLAELQLAAFLAGRGSVTGMKNGTRVAKPAPSMDDFRRMAQSAILPIIKAERIRGGEMVKEAAADRCAKHMMDCLYDKDIQKRWPNIKRDNDWYASMVRALSVPAIVEAGDGKK